MPPHALDFVRVSPSKHFKETDHVIDGLMCAAVRFEVPVRRPTLTAHHTAFN
jgi:hypothetical protein